MNFNKHFNVSRMQAQILHDFRNLLVSIVAGATVYSFDLSANFRSNINICHGNSIFFKYIKNHNSYCSTFSISARNIFVKYEIINARQTR